MFTRGGGEGGEEQAARMVWQASQSHDQAQMAERALILPSAVAPPPRKADDRAASNHGRQLRTDLVLLAVEHLPFEPQPGDLICNGGCMHRSHSSRALLNTRQDRVPSLLNI